jgi:uncharacterized protein (TIGR04141 family)
MARLNLSTSPVALRRFHGNLPLRDYLLLGDALTIEYDGPFEHDGITGYMVAGTRINNTPAWSAHPRSITGEQVSLYGSTPFQVVLIPVGEWVFALPWGSGRYLLDDALLDDEFALHFAIRRLNPARLGMLSSSTLDIRARNTQTTFPSGSHVAGFGLGVSGELVARICGPADVSGLTYHQKTGKPCRIRAGSSLTVQLGVLPETLLADLQAICTIVQESDQDSPLRFIGQIRPLTAHHAMLPELERHLAAALGGDDQFGPLGLAWPSEIVNDIDEANSFFSSNIGKYGAKALHADLQIEDLTAEFALVPEVLRVAHLSDARLAPCADEHGEELLSRPIQASKWLIFETVVDHRTYCFHQGRWYEIGEEAVARVRTQVAELMANKSNLTFPLWTPTGKQDDEHRYCVQVAKQPGYLVLDQNFAKTTMHKKFELADIIGPNNELVHVKWLARATAASHLYVQAEVSAWSQREEPAAVQQLHAKVNKLDRTRSITERPRTVVLAAGGRQWDVEQLFTLSQVGLLRLNMALQNMGVKLEFADIPFVPKTKAAKNKGTASGQAA